MKDFSVKGKDGYYFLKSNDEGYYLETDQHRYDFYELVPIGATKDITSDMVMIVCDDYDKNPDSFTEIIGWEFGALDFPNTYSWDHIAEMIENYEKTGKAMRI